MDKSINWKITETDANIPLMAETLGIGPITARVMANRGIRSKKRALTHLNPSPSLFLDGFLMKDMKKAVSHIFETIKEGKNICIYGDYDADGIIGVVILYKTLKSLGGQVSYYIPQRAEEGYGLNIPALKHIAEEGAGLLITIDNGVSAVDEVDEAGKLGMDVIIVDHHEPGFTHENGEKKDILPAAYAVVNPKQAECAYPFKSLCAAGLAYKLSIALFGEKMPKVYNNEFMALAAIATICDIVDLYDENRIIVKNGLEILNKNKMLNPGLGCLILKRGYIDKTIDTYTAGFILGPCLNATGRLASACLSVQLLLAEPGDTTLCDKLADTLSSLNDERKNMTAEGYDRAMEMIKQQEGRLDKVVLHLDKDTNESISGIIAGRIKECLHRPVIMLTYAEQPSFNDANEPGTVLKGSGRSIEAYNMFSALQENKDLLIRFGGHAMAVGLTLNINNLDALIKNLNNNCGLTEDNFVGEILIDQVLDVSEISLQLSDELGKLTPFGKGNREPVFASYGLIPESVRVIEAKNTIIFSFLSSVGKRLKGICFGLVNRFAEEKEKIGGKEFTIDAAYIVETNHYMGTTSVQIRIIDFILKGI